MKMDNLTGGQIMEILDGLLYKALEPIVYRSNALDIQLIYILGLITKNKKRKLSSLNRDKAIRYLCNALICSHTAKKFHYIRAVRIERGFLHNFIARLLKEIQDYPAIHQQFLLEKDPIRKKMAHLKLKAMARSTGCKKSSDLFVIYHTCKDFLKLVYEYRSRIIDCYVKMVYKQAKSYCSSNSYNDYDFSDVRQNFLTAITKAIDKYDSSKGALTSYINWWLLNAQTCATADHEYGIAYTLPQLQKKNIASGYGDGNINFSVSLDFSQRKDEDEISLNEKIPAEAEVLDDLIKEEKIETIKALAKEVDINGCARLCLDIDEHFTDRELRKMRWFQRKEQKMACLSKL